MRKSGKPQYQLFLSPLIVASLLCPWATALAGDDFAGADWQPKPLVDYNAPTAVATQSQAATPKAAPAAPPVQPDLEARLKPVEPFVKEVENRLSIKPKAGTGLVSRLNNLQTVLFGAQQYNDAGQLITKLSEIFPEEAKKAQAELDKQAQQAQANAAATAKSGKVAAPANPQVTPNPQVANAATQTKPVKKRRSFWNTDDFDSDFDNDPFFQDSFQARARMSGVQAGGLSSTTALGTAQQQAMTSTTAGTQAYSPQTQGQYQGPSRIASIAQGLAGLALVVGGIAGSSYLNGKLGKGTPTYGYPNGYYGNGVPYNPYGYPYGSPYGTAYGAPVYGSGYGVNPYGVGVSPYGVGSAAYGYGSGFNTSPGYTITRGGYGPGTPFWQPYRGY